MEQNKRKILGVLVYIIVCVVIIYQGALLIIHTDMTSLEKTLLIARIAVAIVFISALVFYKRKK